MQISEERKGILARAEQAARAVLKVGDVLRVRRCGGVVSTLKMTGWDGCWITSYTRNDIHPAHILKVNGKSVDFTKPLSDSQRREGSI